VQVRLARQGLEDSMKRAGLLTIAYFPIVLTSSQLLINLGFIFDLINPSYLFILNTFFGVNVFFAWFLVLYTRFFSFCVVSQAAAYAELILAFDVLFINSDHIYNLIFQSIVLFIGIATSTYYYIRKYPTSMISMGLRFMRLVFKNGFHCERTVKEMQNKSYNIYLKKYHHNKHVAH